MSSSTTDASPAATPAATAHPETPAAPEQAGYGRLLRTPDAWRFLLPGFAGRIAFAMLVLGIVLLVKHATGSYGTAGAVAAAASIAQALIGPQTGRLADRYGQAAVLVPAALVHAAAVGALIWLAMAGAPVWTLFAAAVPAGASVPQIAPMVRARWTATTEEPALQNTAFAFESVTDELTFVLGPVLVTALATAVHPAAGLATEAGLMLLGTLAFAAYRGALPTLRQTGSGSTTGPGAMGVPGVRVLAFAFLGVGTVFGSLQVGMTAFAEEAGSPGASGPLYAVFAGASMVAGLIYGARTWRSPAPRRLLLGLLALTVACALLPAVPNLWLLAAAGLLTGLAVAPALITAYTLVGTLAPISARTEAFAWMVGAVGLGQAAGSSLAGQLTDRAGASIAFAVPAAGAALALVVVALLRRFLQNPARM